MKKIIFSLVIFALMACCFLSRANAETAEEALNKGIDYINNQENYDAAIIEINKAIELSPNWADAYYNRGLAYSDKHNYDQAISDYNKAIELNPNYAEAYNNRAIDYYLKGNYDMAWQDVHKAESLGFSPSSFWLKDLKEASGREN